MSKLKKGIAILGLIALLLFISIFVLSKYNIETGLNNYWYEDENKVISHSEIIRCDNNLLHPAVAFLSEHVLLEDIDELKVYFYRIKDIFSKNENTRDFIGVATVTNTTFPELVKMVKEDCSQFQADYNNPDSDGIDWGYREAEPAPTPEQIKEEEDQRYYSMVKSTRYQFSMFTELQKRKFTEVYGDIMSMTDDEVYQVAKRIKDNGFDESLKKYFYDAAGNPILK